MVKFETNGNLGKVVMNIPTTIEEITPEYLKNVTADVKVADNYSLIAIIYRETLANVILAGRKKNNTITTGVVPVMVKQGAHDAGFFDNLNTGDKVIIAASDIAMGHHVTVPNNRLTINNILAYIEGDKSAYQNAMKCTGVCCFIEFKLVPNCNIHGFYSTVEDDLFATATCKNQFITIEL